MLAQPVGGPLDGNHDGVVQQPVEQRRGHHGVAEDLRPFAEAAVAGEDQGTTLVAGVDELEEQVRAARGERQVADLVDDEQRVARVEADALPELSLAFGLGERAHEVGERGEIDALAGPDGLQAEREGKVRLAGARRPQEMHHLAPLDEGEAREREDAVAVERGLEPEVEALERLQHRETRRQEGHLDAPALAQLPLLGQELFEEFIGLGDFDTRVRCHVAVLGYFTSAANESGVFYIVVLYD